MSTQQIITANALKTGAVVYLDADGRWVETLARAAVAADDSALHQLKSAAERAVGQCEVTSVYAFTVRVVNGSPVPLSVRETIRAARAPTV
mgnify:CR=1 FL=1